MKNSAFETRQRAEDLIREAISIWRQSDQSDYLEGLENDPVFKLIMMAMAYQANEIDSEIERLKEDVIDEYTKLLLPYMSGHAVPASVVVSADLADNVGDVVLDSNSVFTLSGTAYKFIPLLKSRAFNVQVQSVVRLDGRRWKLGLEFADNLESLQGFSFIVKDSSFSNLKLFMDGRQLPLSKPWDTANLPYSEAFSLDTMLFNRSPVYDASTAVSDLFCSHDIRIFSILEHDPAEFGYAEKTRLELEFEFEGISVDYPFSREMLVVNPVVLVNAEIGSAHISTANPFARVGGERCQFMHLVSPPSELVLRNSSVQVRKVAADRFNRSSLVGLLNNLTAKFSSDFYAFQNIHTKDGDKVIQAVNSLIGKLSASASSDGDSRSTGTYIVLRQGFVGHKSDIDIDVSYLTTDGAAVNSSLTMESRFSAPPGIKPDSVTVLSAPVEGCDEIDPIDFPELATFYIATNNRIVTPADMRLFCTTELSVRYGISQNMIKSVRVRRQQDFAKDCGYQLYVSIVLKDNIFVRRSLGEKAESAASRLEKMMTSRSSGIYPIKVEITLDNN